MMLRYALSVFSLFVLASCGQKQEYTQPVIEKITESVYASGYLKSNEQYQVFAKVNGLLQNVWVKKGDVVKKGQLIFTLSNEVSKLNVANAQLNAVNADYFANLDKLRELDLAIEVSMKKLANDQLLLERQRTLWAEQIGTKFELEQRELSYANSKATYESAKLRYNELKKQLSFSSKQSKHNLSISRSMLDDYNVRSEVNGMVYSIEKEQGEMVSPQAPLAILGSAQHFTIILQVDENDIVKVAPGKKVFITMDSYKGQVFEAVVDHVNPLMNERSRTFEVEASFLKAPEILYPNLTLEANIIMQSKDNAMTIPRKYLVDDTYVMMSESKRKVVKVGLKDYQKVEILQGLNKDDNIMLPR
jgi:multidrug efflux pump subunit AcrA (membrane-fusion protein)